MTTASKDRRDIPAYPLAEAARYVRIPTQTLRSWVKGRAYPRAGGQARFEPLISLPLNGGGTLSFNNMIEAHVLKSLRSTEHGVSIQNVRLALDYAENKMGIERLLLSEALLSYAGEVFLHHYGSLVNLSKSGQLSMERLLKDYLLRVERDDSKLPIRLFPFVHDEAETPRTVAIDPLVAFGRPVVWSKRISTRTITERIDAGESVQVVASDYGLDKDEVERAILYERAA